MLSGAELALGMSPPTVCIRSKPTHAFKQRPVADRHLISPSPAQMQRSL
jgi:hypothetical protein